MKPCLELTNFVEKQHAAIGRPNQTLAAALGARKRAPTVPEKLALCKGWADRTAVDRYKWPLTPLRIKPMDSSRQLFFARPGFARKQHRQIAEAANTQDRPQDRKHLRALGDDSEVLHRPLNSLLFGPGSCLSTQRRVQNALKRGLKARSRTIEHVDRSCNQGQAAYAQRQRVNAVSICDNFQASLLETANHLQTCRLR